MKIAILSRDATLYSTERLREAGEARQGLGDAPDDDGAGARAGGDDAHLGQFLEALAQGRAGDCERLGHFALRGQRLARGDATGIEHGG